MCPYRKQGKLIKKKLLVRKKGEKKHEQAHKTIK